MKRVFGCLALLASGIAASASAEPPRPWSAEMTVGRQYDSNVTIDEIDRVSHVGDLATLAEAQGAWRLHPMRNTDLRLNYNLSYVLHDDFAAFNQQVQSVGADLSHDFGAVDATLSWRHSRNRLAGKDFATANQFVAGLSHSFGRQWQLRGSYSLSDRSYDGRPQRDAVNRSLSLDGYYYLTGAANFVSLGLRHSDEDARADPFSFRGDGGRVRAGRRFVWASHLLTGNLTWQYEDRRYVGVTASIVAPRHDERSVAAAHLEAQLRHGISLSGDIAVSDYVSNLPSADYSQQIVSFRLAKDF